MGEISALSQIDFPTFFFWIFLSLSAMLAIITLFGKLCGKLGIKFKFLEERREDHKALVDLQARHEESVKQSIRHDKEIKDELHQFTNEMHEQMRSLTENINAMSNDIEKRFRENEDRERKRVRAELKDRIGQSYRYYHSIGKINDMEWDALVDLITEYEEYGGENSFVHTTVQPEMYTWERVK